jgi:hypothetical protein
VEAPLVRGSWQVKDEWTDSFVSVADGKPVKVRRTWTASKTSSSTKGKAVSGMEGSVIIFEERDKAPALVATVEKGTPGKHTVDVLCKGPMDTVLMLLPSAPLAVGASFKVPSATVDRFLRQICAIAPSADRGSVGDLAKVIESLSAEKESLRAVELAAKLVSVQKDEALIEYAGTMPKGLGTTEIKASLRWNVATGKPVRLEWSAKRVVLPNDDLRSDGYTENITLTRTWK